MVEASLVKAKVVYDKKLDPRLYAVFHHDDDAMNIEVSFNWDTFESSSFLNDLRDSVAESFDLELKFVDIRPSYLVDVLMGSYVQYMDRFGEMLH